MRHQTSPTFVNPMRTTVSPSEPRFQWQILQHRDAFKSVSLAALMLLSTFASIQYISMEALAASDQDGDGLTYGLEYLMNTAPNDPDSDNDGLPDGWEWQYGLDPLSSNGGDGAVGELGVGGLEGLLGGEGGDVQLLRAQPLRKRGEGGAVVYVLLLETLAWRPQEPPR